MQSYCDYYGVCGLPPSHLIPVVCCTPRVAGDLNASSGDGTHSGLEHQWSQFSHKHPKSRVIDVFQSGIVMFGPVGEKKELQHYISHSATVSLVSYQLLPLEMKLKLRRIQQTAYFQFIILNPLKDTVT